MDGLARMEHLCPGLQRGGAAIDDETKLAVPQAGPTVDPEYLAKRSQEHLHRAIHLDETSLCRLHHDRQVHQSFHLVSRTSIGHLPDYEEYEGCDEWRVSSSCMVSTSA